MGSRARGAYRKNLRHVSARSFSFCARGEKLNSWFIAAIRGAPRAVNRSRCHAEFAVSHVRSCRPEALAREKSQCEFSVASFFPEVGDLGRSARMNYPLFIAAHCRAPPVSCLFL